MLYFTTTTLIADAGLMVTGSHNPPNHNGFKMMLGRAAFYGPAIQDLGLIADAGAYADGPLGDVVERASCSIATSIGSWGPRRRRS